MNIKRSYPNPDVMCNKEIKFKAFLEHALKLEPIMWLLVIMHESVDMKMVA